MGYGYDVAELLAEIDALKQERDAVQTRANELLAKATEWAAAAKDTAGSLIVALDRLERYQPIADTASEWAGCKDKAKRHTLAQKLLTLALIEYRLRSEAA